MPVFWHHLPTSPSVSLSAPAQLFSVIRQYACGDSQSHAAPVRAERHTARLSDQKQPTRRVLSRVTPAYFYRIWQFIQEINYYLPKVFRRSDSGLLPFCYVTRKFRYHYKLKLIYLAFDELELVGFHWVSVNLGLCPFRFWGRGAYETCLSPASLQPSLCFSSLPANGFAPSPTIYSQSLKNQSH